MKRGGLISLTASGLYCRQGDFYIDPWKPVKKAIVTHAHSDHAYRGNGRYLVPAEGRQLFEIRLDHDAKISTLRYGQTSTINGIKVSFHPAGHILGSAQVRVEHKGEIWVISGDYKLTPDATCAQFESLKCHHFITEATFGLPIYRWQPTQQTFNEVNDWWRRNIERGKASVLFAYALGKAQRLMSGLDRSLGKVFTHGSVERLTQAYREAGIDLPKTQYAGSVTNKKEFAGSMIIAPPSAQASTWLRRFGPQSTGFASGWMMVRGARRQRAIDRGFVLSDHADWPELIKAIRETEAETVYVTHGFAPEVVRYLNETGMNAVPLKTQFVGDDARDMLDEESEPELGAPEKTEK
jgi:putative mRNA 3-end processing factor